MFKESVKLLLDTFWTHSKRKTQQDKVAEIMGTSDAFHAKIAEEKQKKQGSMTLLVTRV